MRYYATEILDALRSTIGNTIGGVDVKAHPEGHPIGWLDDEQNLGGEVTRFPAIFYVPSEDFPAMPYAMDDEGAPLIVTQIYALRICYVMVRGESGNPFEVVRARGEEIAIALDPASETPFNLDSTLNSADRYMGSAVGSVGTWDEVEAFLRGHHQHLTSSTVDFTMRLHVKPATGW